MTDIPITIIYLDKEDTNDPQPVPSWFDDPEQIGPCPCGNPPHERCVLVEGDTNLKRWFHEECLDFLENEMDEEEIEEKRAWEQHVKQIQENDENDFDF